MTEARAEQVVSALADAFADLMDRDPQAFRVKFRKMARDPRSFYRGSAALFYQDLTGDGDFADLDDPWVRGDPRIWVHGDLHVENFGTYLDASGRLVFDVNDFDEAYVGRWTWDLRRFVASLAVVCWQKALPDRLIEHLVRVYVTSYVEHVRHYVDVDDDTEWALTLANADGAVRATLQRARLQTRFALLESMTTVGRSRRFTDGPGVRRIEDGEREAVCEAFERYQGTIPDDRRFPRVMFDVLDVVGKQGFGIGSAGLPAYSVLIEGFSQALDNDVVLSVKQGNVAAPSRVVDVGTHFEHHGHRTAVSQRALQAHADRFLGWTDIDGTGYVVRELSPYEAELSWDELTEPDDLEVLVDQLGRATAKIHCVADEHSEAPFIADSVEDHIAESIGDAEEDLVRDMTAFALAYGERTREDHARFVDAFRGGAFDRVAPTQ